MMRSVYLSTIRKTRSQTDMTCECKHDEVTAIFESSESLFKFLFRDKKDPIVKDYKSKCVTCGKSLKH